MAPQESTPIAQRALPRLQRRYHLRLSQSDNLSNKLSSLSSSDGNDTSPISSPKKKKIRIQSADEILKELALNAVEEMKQQGLLEQSECNFQCEDIAAWDSRIGDKYDCLLANSSQVSVDDSDVPQSPQSFFKRIGLKNATRPKPRMVSVLPPERPAIFDVQLKSSSQFSTAPSACTTPESGSSRRNPFKSIGNVTPATAKAAQYLLDLRR